MTISVNVVFNVVFLLQKLLINVMGKKKDIQSFAGKKKLGKQGPSPKD